MSLTLGSYFAASDMDKCSSESSKDRDRAMLRETISSVERIQRILKESVNVLEEASALLENHKKLMMKQDALCKGNLNSQWSNMIAMALSSDTQGIRKMDSTGYKSRFYRHVRMTSRRSGSGCGIGPRLRVSCLEHLICRLIK